MSQYQLEYKRRRSQDGKRLTSVGIAFDGVWIGYYHTFASAVTALTIRKVPVEQARKDVAPYWPNRRK